MDLDHFYAAILAGGRGTRLWPQSREHHPKQFADILGSGRTMIQATADRLRGLAEGDHLYVITGNQYADLTADQLPQTPAENILIEPSGRNTAPAIGLACVHLRRRDPDAIMAIFPADHVITDEVAFRQAVGRAIEAADAGYLVTLGIQPTEPHTGYGYIKRGDPIPGLGEEGAPVYAMVEFLEKPDRAQAKAFLDDGGYYWNGGIFISRVDRMLSEIERQMPDVFARLEAIDAGLDGADPEGALRAAWADMPAESIDYGVMEGAQNAAVAPMDAGWNDVGSWDALTSILDANDDGNLVIRTDIVSIDSNDNIVYGKEKFVALVGVDNLIVVDAGDALLVGRRDEIQKVKQVVDALHSDERNDLI